MRIELFSISRNSGSQGRLLPKANFLFVCVTHVQTDCSTAITPDTMFGTPRPLGYPCPLLKLKELNFLVFTQKAPVFFFNFELLFGFVLSGGGRKGGRGGRGGGGGAGASQTLTFDLLTCPNELKITLRSCPGGESGNRVGKYVAILKIV